MQAIEGAGRAGDDIGRNAGIDRRRRQPAMAEQHLDDADIGAGFEQMRGEAVAQRVNGDRLAQIRLAAATRQAACNVAVLTGRSP